MTRHRRRDRRQHRQPRDVNPNRTAWRRAYRARFIVSPFADLWYRDGDRWRRIRTPPLEPDDSPTWHLPFSTWIIRAVIALTIPALVGAMWVGFTDSWGRALDTFRDVYLITLAIAVGIPLLLVLALLAYLYWRFRPAHATTSDPETRPLIIETMRRDWGRRMARLNTRRRPSA